MSKQDDKMSSGNDGSWFLEAVGAVPPAPTPSESVTALEFDNTTPDLKPVDSSAGHTATVSAFNGDTGTSTSTYERPREMITPLPHDTREITKVTPSLTPLVETDMDLNPVLRTKRSFRWPAVAFGVFLIAMAALAALWLPAALKQDAVGVKQSYADAALNLRQELPLGQSALDTITDPSSTSDELSATVPAISQLDSAARELTAAASEPLPRQIPVFPVDEITALGPLQDIAQIRAAQGSDIARNLGYTYVYRTTIPELLVDDSLPTSADVQEINALSIELASSLVNDSDALSDLPVTEATADLNAAAHAAVERYAFWQDEYLTALSEGNESAAASLIEEMEAITADLLIQLDTAMATARIEIDQQIVELAADLETYLEVLTR